MVKRGDSTIWGIAQDVEEVVEGVQWIDTSSHGGFRLDEERNLLIPKVFRNKGGWYEEDVECAKVFVFIPGTDNNKNQFYIAHKHLKNYFWREYEECYGVVLHPEESRSKAQYLFTEANKNNLVGIAAWGDWKSGVPKGKVGVMAVRGGRNNNGHYASDEHRYFFVDEKRYQSRKFSYVIDESVDEETDWRP